MSAFATSERCLSLHRSGGQGSSGIRITAYPRAASDIPRFARGSCLAYANHLRGARSTAERVGMDGRRRPAKWRATLGGGDSRGTAMDRPKNAARIASATGAGLFILRLYTTAGSSPHEMCACTATVRASEVCSFRCPSGRVRWDPESEVRPRVEPLGAPRQSLYRRASGFALAPYPPL